MRGIILSLLAALGASVVHATSSFDPTHPPAIPLAVRSPYLNTWLKASSRSEMGGYLAGQWPVFWAGALTEWTGFIVVDDEIYKWMGDPNEVDEVVDQTKFEYTSTRSRFVMEVEGKVEMEIIFLSPVFPNDKIRQSLTFSYLEVIVRSIDGKGHRVHLYSDISAEFASGDRDAVVHWDHDITDGVRFHRFWKAEQITFNETHEQADWGNWYWATDDQARVTYQAGRNRDVRRNFVRNKKLDNTIEGEDKFRAVKDKSPVFGFARDLGNVGKSGISTLFSIGYTQEKAVLFQGAGDEMQEVPSLWASVMDEDECLPYFHADHAHAQYEADSLDERIANDSREAAGGDYVAITSLAVRQTFGGVAYTGTPERTLVWMKEISSNGIIQTVDVMYPTLPFFLYLNPEILRWMLDPLLEHQESGHYPNKWAMHDMNKYARAVGYPEGNDEPMPLEECGNMVIMMAAYSQRSGDTDYIRDHWDILEQWTEYLIEDSKIPADQLSTDDFADHLANQTNLALKGIIGLKAMSELAKVADKEDEAKKWADIADDYIEFWYEHGINRDAELPHTNLQYDEPETHGILYNLYADALLSLNFIDPAVYSMQSAYYPNLHEAYGVPLDTRGDYTKSDWEMWAAAVCPDRSTRDMFVRDLARWIRNTPTDRPMTDWFNVDTGDWARGKDAAFTARPVVGGLFALLALPKDVEEGEQMLIVQAEEEEQAVFKIQAQDDEQEEVFKVLQV